MKHVTLKDYEAAKAEIIGGVEYKEHSTLEGSTIRKTYTTEENGAFYEVNDGGRVEFWSDKHPESRIYDKTERAAAPAAPATTERVPGYGELLSDKIRATTQDFSKLNDFEKFILDRGYLYETEEALKAGYERAWKANHGIMLTKEEFAEEVESRVKGVDTAELYDTLYEHVRAGRMGAGDVMQYAHFCWCLREPEAVVAYEVERGKWAVNNCSTEISEEAARLKVCEEFGFEASRVKIIGTPYYDATDWNFIRFNCAGWCWLMKNGGVDKVYD